MTHTLVSFLGRARQDPETGYRAARYRFPDGSEHNTPFFGLALKDHLKPDHLVVLGTAGSMWDVLIEHLATEGDEETLRLELIDAAEKSRVNNELMTRITPLIERNLSLPCTLTLIDYGRDTEEQQNILRDIAKAIPTGSDHISLDLTHGFRHLAALGLLSAFFLERVTNLPIQGLYYGANDMRTANDITPVIHLDGLIAIQHWNDALDRFDQNGDYAVFAPLLQADGMPTDKTQCLKRAAYYERTLNLNDARAQIQSFLLTLDAPLTGPSALFQDALKQRLAWARNGNLFNHQARLARFYLGNDDYLRAALFGYEAIITRECGKRGLNPHDWKQDRIRVTRELEKQLSENARLEEIRRAYWMLKNLRNSLAHGNPPQNEDHREIIANPERLPQELKKAMNVMLNNQNRTVERTHA